jgi:serine/threonine-protein kinase RsbT
MVTMRTETTIPIDSDVDVVVARQEGRSLAVRVGLSDSQQTMVATAISEVARNIVAYAGRGEIRLAEVVGHSRRGVEVVAYDEGPGIADVELAMTDGYSTTGSLGLGLPGARRLMDDFELDTAPGRGPTVTLRKWRAAGS